MPPSNDGGLGSALVGEKIAINSFNVTVSKLLGEGGFAYVYLVKDTPEGGSMSLGDTGADNKKKRGSFKGSDEGGGGEKMVLKVTSILSRQQRDIAEKEAKLLSRLTHPSIVKMIDTCYRTVPISSGSGFRKSDDSKSKERQQHLILMEFCEGGHAMDICTKMVAKGERFDLSTLIIAFGQICNAVSYLHAQRPPIIHRDLKPENFLVKNGAYKLCDFGSAVFGHVELKTPDDRREAEEVIEKTTTQMFRAPEMVDLYMAKKLTQATDVWALGCCLYSLAFLKNCFEEGSNLAILSRNYKIPDDNPYGDGLVELIDRMLTDDSKARADMTEVILCLSAVYSGKPLPPRKERKSKDKKEKEHKSDKDKDRSSKDKKKKGERTGTFRTDGQGVDGDLTLDHNDPNRPKEAKKLDPNSAAARRRRAAAGGGDGEFAPFDNTFEYSGNNGKVDDDLAFSTADNPFASFEGTVSRDDGSKNGSGIFGSFDDADAASWDGHDFDKSCSSPQNRGRGRESVPERTSTNQSPPKKERSRSQDHRRSRKKDHIPANETPEEAIDRLAAEDEDDDGLAAMARAAAMRGAPTTPNSKKAAIARRGVRRVVSNQPVARARSRGAGIRRSRSGRSSADRQGSARSVSGSSHEDDGSLSSSGSTDGSR